MKKALFLLALIVALSNTAFCQNRLDPPSFGLSDTSVYDFDWNNSHFVRGWNWGGSGAKLDSAKLVVGYKL